MSRNNKIFAQGRPLLSSGLLALAAPGDFALRLRALLLLGRLGESEAFLPLVELLKRERENHWRLAILDALFMLPYEDKISPLLPLLAEEQPGDGDSYFFGGLIWFLGQQGQAALAPLSEHVLACPARARRIKDGLLAEAVFHAAGGDADLLARLSEDNPPLYRFCAYRVWPKDLCPHFGLYPHPDYLLQKSGLTHGQFKRLFHWHRSKSPKNLGSLPQNSDGMV